jgi:hypothetical protein
MRRRELITLPGGATVLPLAAHASPSMIRARAQTFMRRFAVLFAAFVMVSCSPEEEVTSSIQNKCATDLYNSYNPKVLDQCVDVCIKCYRGNMTTCSTSCTLKGAR